MFVPLFMLAALIGSVMVVIASMVGRPVKGGSMAIDAVVTPRLKVIRVESVPLDSLSHGDKFYMPYGELVQKTLVIDNGLYMAEFDGRLCAIAVPMVNRVIPTV